MPTVLIGLNGPPGCGKDYGALILKNELLTIGMSKENVVIESLAKPMKQAVHEFLSLPLDYIPANKDSPSIDFFDTVPRKIYIDFAENFVKPSFNPAIFGKLLVRRLFPTSVCGLRIIILTDSGFFEEIIPIARLIGSENVRIVRIHRDRYDFSNDSRSYLPDSDEYTSSDLFNAGVRLSYRNALFSMMLDFLPSVKK